MTPTDLLTTAHTETGTESDPVTKAEVWLAIYASILEKGCSAAHIQAAARVAFLQNAEPRPVEMDKQETAL